jgi:flagellar hook-basal body complex protein FliE
MTPVTSLNLAVGAPFDADLFSRLGTAAAGKNLPAGELSSLTPLTDGVRAPQTAGTGDAFSTVLGNMVQDVNTRQVAAGEAVNGLLSGQNVNLHQAMIAMEEASVSFQLMVEVRNRLLESYQELMRMQI